VVVAGWDNRGYGNMILLDNGNGYQTRFGHLSEIDVQAGQAVQKGQLIGRVGSTGRSTGPHLHFEIILNGVNRNPFGFLR
jgi:murein DD-endopeptidase MepM/ murein hydrolase activator NlpD